MSELNQLKKEYQVNDLIQETSKIIFVLESPHKKELEFSVPVAGPSGKTMTKKLFEGYEEPLGRLLGSYIHNGEGPEGLSHIGIMNICPIPMQASAYREEEKEKYKDYFEAIEKIRTSQKKKKFKDEKVEGYLEEILDDFRERLEKLPLGEIIFVPCGNFARFMFQEAVQELESIEYLNTIPHPSYNSWNQERYAEVINELLELFKSKKG